MFESKERVGKLGRYAVLGTPPLKAWVDVTGFADRIYFNLMRHRDRPEGAA